MGRKTIGTPKGEMSLALKVVEIPLAEIVVGPRMRPVNERAVQALAPSVSRYGVRQPIEVAKAGKGWRLVSGLHRLEASRRAGYETIPAVVVRGTVPELRKMEISENLTRNDLSALERCQFTAELKRMFLAENPEAGHGGDRQNQTGESKRASLRTWYQEIAVRSERGGATVRRQAAIGEHLDGAAADHLRGTDFEDNQFELEALSKRPPEEQRDVARLLTHKSKPAGSVRAALAELTGMPAAAGERNPVGGYLDRWRRWPRENRRAFIYELSDAEFEEMIELRQARDGEAS